MRSKIFLLVVYVSWSLVAVVTAHPPATVHLQKVLDGDTADVMADGVTYRLRLIAVNAPELHDIAPCGRRWALAAQLALTELTQDQPLTVTMDVTPRDKYGRWLVYLWRGDLLVNEAMIERGYAVTAASGKNTRYRAAFKAAQARAEAAQRGMWSP